VQSPEYVKELVQHHVGGYLKIAPEHTEQGPLTKMMKPGIGSYDKFKQMFEKFSAEAGKKQYLIPYFIAAHPGTSDEDMMNLAIWLKKNGFRADQVQTFYPRRWPRRRRCTTRTRTRCARSRATARRWTSCAATSAAGLHKAFLRYHDPNNWPLLREALKAMGRADLIGNGKHHLIPTYQPLTDGSYASPRRKNSTAAPAKPARAASSRSTPACRRASPVPPSRPASRAERKEPDSGLLDAAQHGRAAVARTSQPQPVPGAASCLPCCAACWHRCCSS
jgi:hypothetical protein